jgi:prevent-host-death family protein
MIRSTAVMAKTATIKSSELQRASGTVLKRVAVDKEHLVVERNGWPVAVVMPFADYEQLTSPSRRAPRRMKREVRRG